MIEEILGQNEGKTLEFKENTKSLASIIKTVIAFANTAGGIIVIGVEDATKKVVGLENVLLEEERLANSIADAISPLLIPDIEIHTYRKRELIILRVAHGAGPYYLKATGLEKGIYVRFGSTNRTADIEMVEMLRLFAKNISFDEMPCLQGPQDVLEWDFVQELFRSW